MQAYLQLNQTIHYEPSTQIHYRYHQNFSNTQHLVDDIELHHLLIFQYVHILDVFQRHKSLCSVS